MRLVFYLSGTTVLCVLKDVFNWTWCCVEMMFLMNEVLDQYSFKGITLDLFC